jgi:two-component system sensor kinase FixL
MLTENWRHQIETLHHQVETVCAAVAHPTHEPELLQEALAVLQTSMEELRAVEEELYQHHEAVAVAQQATAAVHQWYQALFDCAPDGYLVTDSQGIIQEANRAVAALLAVRQDFLVGKPLALFVVPEERPAFRTQRAALDKVQDLQDWAVHLQPREGPAFDAELTVATVHSLQDQRTGLLWLIRDVTARKQAEEAQARLAAIVASSEDAIIGKTLEGTITSWNQGAERLYGYTAAHVIGRSIAMLAPPDRPDELPAILARLARGEAITHYETIRVRHDGRVIPVSLTISPIRDAGGTIIGASTIARDITARQQAEAALRDSEARQQAILQTAADGIITIDERGTVESFNPPAERLFGYTATEVIGNNIRILMPSPYREAHDGYLRRYCQTGESHIIGIGREVRGLRRDGTTFPMALAVSEVRLGDRRLFSGIVHNLSARVQAEEALRQAHDELEQRVRDRTEALQEANNDIRRFAYIVSHDLRAPLINLHGFADELRDACTVLTTALPGIVPHLEGCQGAEVTRALQDDIPEALGFIETAVTRMDHLIQAVLQLSRLGRQELHIEPISTEALVHETLRTLAHQITQRQVQVTVEPLPVVHADHLALAQIFGNLLANAVAYLEPSRPGAIAITAAQRPSVTVFAVQDNGRGIAEADIPHVFEPFRRVGRQDVPGEGMGLAYVRTLVRRVASL